MVFNSMPFLAFFLLLFCTYYIVPLRWRTAVLLVFSIAFYLFSGVQNLPFITAALLVAYFAAVKMGALYEQMEKEIAETQPSAKEKTVLRQQYKRRCKRYLAPAVILVMGVLVLSKAGSLTLRLLRDYLAMEEDLFTAIVPLGISYYTFSLTGYLLDVYWGKMKAVRSLPRLALGAFWFPQILQGPIARYRLLLPQLEHGVRFDYARVCGGLQLMLWGYFKKIVVADRLTVAVTTVFSGSTPLAEARAYTIAAGLFCSAMQLYADFSACMDIGRGVSKVFGITLAKNFEQPFFSTDVAQFWRRWHVTLGEWFKDYVYLPVSASPRLIRIVRFWRERHGARVGKTVGTLIPLLLVWLLTGVWHGTGLNYVLWGLYYGMLISCATIFAPELKKLSQKLHIDTQTHAWRQFQVARTTALFCLGRLITIPATLQDSAAALGVLLTPARWLPAPATLGLNLLETVIAVSGVGLMLAADAIQAREGSARVWLQKQNIVLRWLLYYGLIAAILVFGMYGKGYTRADFVYMNF